MDWFERLTGFRETDYDDTRAKLRIAIGLGPWMPAIGLSAPWCRRSSLQP